MEEDDSLILAILQARTSSSRLPGKVLESILGQPMILRQLERIEKARFVDKIVVATSTDPSDDLLAETLTNAGFTVRRGPLGDVFQRFAIVIDEFVPENIVRLTADCPLTDPEIIDQVIIEHLSSSTEYTNNTTKPTFADGLDVEVFTREAFNELRKEALSDAEIEHVTLGFRSTKRSFQTHCLMQEPDLGHLRWTVDVADDLEFVRTIYSRLYNINPDFLQKDILELLSKEPSLNRTQKDEQRNAALRKLSNGEHEK